MNIDFKRETMFERFSIPTSTSKNDLFRKFQTTPELRKELPNYIQTINNEQKLFVDELFSTFQDNEIYSVNRYLEDQKNEIKVNLRKKIASFVYLTRDFVNTVSVLKISGKVFDNLLNDFLNLEDLSIFYHSNCSNKEEIYNAFKESCIGEIKKQITIIINSYNSKNVNSLYRVINAITDVKLRNDLINSFSFDLGTAFETMSSRFDDEKFLNSSIKFITELTNTIFKNKQIYPAYKFCCNKLIEKNAKIDLKNICTKLNDTDIKAIIDIYVNKSLEYILFENIEKHSYDEICEVGEIAENIVEIAKNKELDIENINIIKILVAFRDKGEEWYDKYSSCIKSIVEKRSLSASIFNVCYWIYQTPDLMLNKILFSNLILAATNFEVRMDSIFGYINRVEKAASLQYSSQMQGQMVVAAIQQKQEEMYNLIMDFYAITIIVPDYVKIFDQLYELLTTRESEALERMKKCDKARSANITHKNLLNDAMRARSSYSPSYRPTQSSGCYIASCVYGSYNCPEVWVLRRYRDNNLGSNWFGRLFIKIYYAISPTLVKIFGKTKWFKSLFKKILDRKVKRLQKLGYDNTPYKDKKWN